MSENERLREALRDMIELSVEDNSMWELHEESFRARRRAARNALASKPDVCVWHLLNNGRRPKLFERDCDHREVKMPLSRPPGTVYVYYDTICAGCGAKIEVRE